MKIGFIDNIGETEPGVARPYLEIRDMALAAETESFSSPEVAATARQFAEKSAARARES